jgi:hypothetical protein
VRKVQTNPFGVYNFLFLSAGTDDLEVSAVGFRTQTRTNLVPAVVRNVRFDFKPDVGAVSENVTVEAETEAVKPNSAELGAVVDHTKVVEMPLNGRLFW